MLQQTDLLFHMNIIPKTKEPNMINFFVCPNFFTLICLGMINWYATHGTSMNNTNPLLSGDNKGYASQLFEYWLNGGALPGKGPFVAAFAQANCGDASPNTDGAKCQDTGLPCQMENSTCNGRSQLCYASGPGKDMMESTKIIGEKQFEKAWELYFDTSNQVKLSGPVQYRMQYVEIANFTFPHPNGEYVTTCEPALGYSFAAGTTDGPGAFDFTQGMTEGNSFWNTIVGSIREPRSDVQKCQNPKPILLDTGNYNYPYPWHPRIVDTQIGRIGSFFIAAVPGEFTSMAGRRLKDKIIQKASDHGLHDSIAVIAGLSNVYSHYITTFEEYQVQRYEGASTLFGPNTHEAYMYQYAYLFESMATGSTLDKGPLPPDLLDEQVCFLPRHHYDTTYKNKIFGSVLSQPYPYIYKGETQVAVFVAGNPRNDVRLGDTFLTVERKVNSSYWETIATDASWETRIKHFGNVTLFSTGKKKGYDGVTQEFMVSDPSSSRFEPKENFRPPISTDPFGWVKHYFG
ncbi:Neutral ceramidase [Armadillidium nasatum]|uniref:Neutral ceramidase n=1 Tax=Armadillidium nasatum TaxID=96803 RepID=A0A5N5TPN0_9CRUS|nr:Neutral ceramidase [Armadillidium nasatum]